ncbi:MAG: cytochrome c peroxidase [Myxococcota bacterium]
MAALGRRLFHEPRLSRDGTLSCASCHKPELAFTDGKTTAEGVQARKGTRNTPTIINRALGARQFWDGRAATLEEQALGPIANPLEMDLPLPRALAILNADAGYVAEFRAVFGAGPDEEKLALALSAYERTVWSVDSPFDRFLAGDEAALSPSARRGLELFGGRARCSECHTGINFSDEEFHVLGVSKDPGRATVTGKPEHTGAFKTPTLRDVARTAPYMHDGSLRTLAEVVAYYDRGGNPVKNLDHRMTPLKLSAQEQADLVAFLESLSGRIVELGLTSNAEPAVHGK